MTTESSDEEHVLAGLTAVARRLGESLAARARIGHLSAQECAAEVGKVVGWARHLAALRGFLRTAAWTFDKPRVMKKKGAGYAFRCDHMAVAMASHLTSGGVSVAVHAPYGFNFKDSVPYTLHVDCFGGTLSLGVDHYEMERVKKDVRDVVAAGLEDRIAELDAELQGAWARVEAGSPAMIAAFRAKRGGSIRKGFREKLLKQIKSCDSLADEDPAFILKVMQMDPGDLELLSKFAKRNLSDLQVATVEDVKESLDTACVSETLES